MPQKSLEVYYALIYLQLLYGLSIWGFTYPTCLKQDTEYPTKQNYEINL